MTAVPRRRRAGQRGQAIPIIALAGTVLLGFTALATDLSLQTHYRRNLQNVTDAAALAGGRDLGAVANQPDRVSAVADALNTVANSLRLPPFPIGWNGGASCVVSQCDASLTSGSYTVTVNVPPRDTPTVAYRTWPYVEVELRQTTQNGIGSIVGAATSTEGARSVGYHFAANQPFGFALYAETVISNGNDGETIAGNVYADRSIDPQSSGHAGFCADTANGSGSYVVFGTPQKGDTNPAYNNDGQWDVKPQSADTLNTVPNCSSTTAGTVNETAVAGSGSCGSLSVQGVTLNTAYNHFINACVASPKISPPVLTGPSGSGGGPYCGSGGTGSTGLIGTQWQAGTYQCSGGTALPAGGNTFHPGVYTIVHNPSCNPKSCFDLDFSGSNVTLTGVTFLLIGGATVGVEKGATVVINPFGDLANPCTITGIADCRYSFYDPTSASAVQVVDLASSLTAYGTMYLPNGSVHVDSNAFLDIASGQAIVNTWDVQSGYHPNPDVTYSGSNSAPQNEVLKLVE